MFDRLSVSNARCFGWFASIAAYWGLIYMAWNKTRLKLYLGAGMLEELFSRQKISAVLQNIDTIESNAALQIAEKGSMSTIFLFVPLVMAFILIISPFVIRRDHKAPVTGIFSLPVLTISCYIFVSLMNVIIAAGMIGGLSYLFFHKPSPDFLMFLIHPLYLFLPFVFGSLPGFLSQLVYLGFTCSVLTTPGAYAEEFQTSRENVYAEKAPEAEEPEDDWDKSACIMELDRLMRIINTKFSYPPFLHMVRQDISGYINRPSQIKNDVKLKIPHYKIVLTEARNSMRDLLNNGKYDQAIHDTFVFIVKEMERMEYNTEEETGKAIEWLENIARQKTASAEGVPSL